MGGAGVRVVGDGGAGLGGGGDRPRIRDELALLGLQLGLVRSGESPDSAEARDCCVFVYQRSLLCMCACVSMCVIMRLATTSWDTGWQGGSDHNTEWRSLGTAGAWFRG